MQISNIIVDALKDYKDLKEVFGWPGAKLILNGSGFGVKQGAHMWP